MPRVRIAAFSLAGFLAVIAAASLWAAAPVLAADKQYAPGITDTEIKIGQTNPYSGPVSAFSTNGLADQAFFKYVNDKGGVNGRKINLISVDDSYVPAKAVEQTRKLIEEDNVAFIYRSLGTAGALAMQKYMNDNKIPQLFVAGGASKLVQPEKFPWTIAGTPSYKVETRRYAKYILATSPNAKIAVLYQDDDLGKDLLAGLREGLGDKADSMIVATASYELTDPTVDSQIVTLQASGADIFFNLSTAKFASQAIRKIADLGWKPEHFLVGISALVGAVLKPAGFDKSIGIVSSVFWKDPSDPLWKDDPEVKDWNAWMDKYLPQGDKSNFFYVGGYLYGNMLVHILAACGNDLSRENIMKQAANMTDVKLPLLLPGVTVNTTPTDYRMFRQARMERFDGTRFVLFGNLLTD